MKTEDLRKMTVSELQKELEDSLREQFNLRMQRGTGQMTRPHLFNEAKKNVARIKTIMREKELKGDKHE